MADYKTSDYAIDIVYGLLGSISVPKYKGTKPTAAVAAEYIVVNALPINANVMQKCYVNVNYHVKDIAAGVKDSIKIKSGSDSVLALLKQVTTTAYLIDFETQETIREEEQGYHYSNLRFSFKNINN